MSREPTADADAPPPAGPAAGPATGGAQAETRRLIRLAAVTVVALLGAGALTGVLLSGGKSHTSLTAPLAAAASVPSPGIGLPQLPASVASVMGISAMGDRPAPPFRLTDQSGATVSLSQIDQHPVVLTFFDTTCIDVCPLLAQEFLGAAKQLGPLAGDVSFVAVNVGVAHASRADVEGFTTAHGLGALPHWYFLTGTPSELRQVWSAYGVTVKVDPVTGGVLHTSVLDFLAPGGRLAYQAVPFANQLPNGTGSLPAAVVAQWEQGIASYAAKTMTR